jgi:hypothetical protein
VGAAVDAEVGPVDVPGVVGAQVGDGGGHHARVTHADRRHDAVEKLGVRAFGQGEGTGDGRVDRAGAHGVGAQTLLGVLDGEGAGERQHAALGR